MNTTRACAGLLALVLLSPAPEAFQVKPVAPATGAPALRTGYPAPDFAFTALDGKRGKLSDYRGKVVLLDFWGTWCGPCVAATPALVTAYDKYHARGFEILGVVSNDTRERLQAFVSERKLSWTQTLDGEYVALANPEVSWTVIGPIVTLYRVIGFPTYVVVGKDGTIAAARVATGDLDAELAKLFDRKP